MENARWRVVTLIALIGVSLWLLWPSIQLYNMPPEKRYGTGDESVAKLRSKAMKLGLDLLGGMDIVLEVDRSKLKADEVKDAVDRAMQILRNRIDQFGVAEPIIQKQGENRILIQLPGLLDKQRAAQLIGKTALLEFKMVQDGTKTRTAVDKLDRELGLRNRAAAGGAVPAATDTSSMASADSANAAADSSDAAHPLTSLLPEWPNDPFVPAENVAAVDAALKKAQDLGITTGNTALALSAVDESYGAGRFGRYLYALDAKAAMTGGAIADARHGIGLDANRPQEWAVSMRLNTQGGRAFSKLTSQNVGKQLAIVLDGKVMSAPQIRDRITGGSATISGGFSGDTGGAEAGDLAIVLRAGALPAPVSIVEERTVGPSLGRDSVSQGQRAALVGAGAVIVFMLVYYQLSGFISLIALALNIFFLFAGMALLKSTLTMPGIAGIALTIGMAVDANVLIFERIREELRNGKRVLKAIDAGFHRAWVTIVDSNLTTLISAVCLFFFGTGPIKGFAVTLGWGILANIYTAVFVTRLIFDAFYARRNPDRLSI